MLNREPGSSAIISVQNLLRLGAYWELQPDLVVLRPRENYLEEPATVADVLILIEVADSWLYSDRRVKLPQDARAGIPRSGSPT